MRDVDEFLSADVVSFVGKLIVTKINWKVWFEF